MRLTFKDFEKKYQEMTSSVICECEAATPIVGGVPATDDGLRGFIQHHLGITDSVEAEKAFIRIREEEMGEVPIPSPEGELSERLTYGVNQIRRTDLGPYLGNWMIHACLKTAASRLNIFKDYRGSKGNFAEAGLVLPYGVSVLDERMDCIYLIGPDGLPSKTTFEEFKGRVSGPRGSVSIIHHSEVVPSGTRFAFEFRFIMGDLTESDIADFLALAMIVGVGSVKSLGNGKFRIVTAEILPPDRKREKPKKDAAKKELVVA